jgi:DNA mismatch repair protein MutS
MLKQYREIKSRYPDALVLYRLGDFYELFEEDAEQASRQLGIVLTSRRFGKDVRLPMCGIPYHRLTGYLARLVRQGHKVAIVEQLEDARKTKRLVKRDVVRVITPGTIVEDALLRDQEQDLLVGLAISERHSGSYGLAVVDLSTGEFRCTQADGPQGDSAFWEEMARLRPAEIVLPHSAIENPALLSRIESIRPKRVSPVDDRDFQPHAARERLKEHFQVRSLEGFGCDASPLAVAAAGATLRYLQANQISDLAHIVDLVTYDLRRYASLDTVTWRNLELMWTVRDRRREGTLYEVIDRTLTAMGRRLLRRWLTRPLLEKRTILDRLQALAELVDRAMLRGGLRDYLDGIYDVERLVGRIGFGNANARDLVALCRALERVPRIQNALSDTTSGRLRELVASFETEPLQRTAHLIREAIVDDPPILLREGGLIRAGYDDRLEKLRQTASMGRDWLTQFEAAERERTGIRNLRVRYNQVFGFFIEVTKSNLSRVPPDYERRATVRHAERYVTPALKAREVEILNAEDRMNDLEYELFAEVRELVATESSSLVRAARTLAELDALASLAEVAAANDYTRPTVDEGGTILIRGGRHPVVERSLASGERFVPNDTTITPEERLLILTGPNMSGKSVYIRQVALIVLLAQIGSFVPAREAHIGMVDGIYVRAGASDDITRGRSTFLVEMSETSYILRHATRDSLVVLDEVGRGTSTYDGVSIAWAVAEELHDRIGARTLFATHFHELTELTQHLTRSRNYTLAVSEHEHQVIFLRQLIAGAADKSYGIQVARLAGLSDRVVDRAKAVLAQLEQSRDREMALSSASELWALQESARTLLRTVDDQIVWVTLQELCHLDIANMTPVQALVTLNELQKRLADRRSAGA